jgi:hypothetical protein
VPEDPSDLVDAPLDNDLVSGFELVPRLFAHRQNNAIASGAVLPPQSAAAQPGQESRRRTLLSMPLTLENSSLLRSLADDPQSDVWDFWGDGDYPAHQAEKAEVERGVAEHSTALSDADVAKMLAGQPRLLEWGRMKRSVDVVGDARRLVAFYEFAVEVRAAEHALHLASLDHPRRDNRVYEADSDRSLFAAITRDGLLPLTSELIPESNGSAYAHFAVGDNAIFPHPWLSDARELVWELVELAEDPAVAVAIAINPHRVVPRADVPIWVLEDYWRGVIVDADSLDSLDTHDLGHSFHGASGRSEGDEFFFPLLGTRFEWRRRGDDERDPVKTMEIEEIVPPDSRVSSDHEFVWNRLAHGERDTARRRFTHLDGKVQLYEKSSYGPSALAPMAAPGHPAHSRKLWRVDGDISDADFANLLGLFYRGNELIEEHFPAAVAWPATVVDA